ncbi:probable 2-oxoglutarate-dependent dioxygenase AOP1 [Salvia miltiorrhiza]|uniref:probable 2-oxoglutarate-dependent dioxygenase AOP1 n=1 Tax=Salvia miltiorrhiza TaxID=226208 RepID=UPI0025AD34C6|nr:probable 2-oxoglutarate-dependent dioxygenase AOP1 [Salvia miltiorrhiza]
MGSETSPELLVVDFNNPKMNAGSNCWSSACKDIRKAFETHGCFVALYDNISPQLHDSIFKATQEVLDLPIQTKLKNITEKPYHGYTGQIPIAPLHEATGIDYANTLHGAHSFTTLMWPQGNQFFCETTMSFAKAVAEIEKMVVMMFFESYGVDKYAEAHSNATTYFLRLMKYDPPSEGETTLGLPPHTDKSFITVLYQNHISGLQTRSRDGQWINVQFPAASFLVMAGDACKAWSNDRVFSATHKVIMDTERKETRYSTGLFSFLSKTLEVPVELVDDEHPLKFKPLAHIDLLKFFATEQGRRSQNLLEDFVGKSGE